MISLDKFLKNISLSVYFSSIE